MPDQAVIDLPRLTPVLADAVVSDGGADPLFGHVERLLAARRPAAARPLLQALKRRTKAGPRLSELEAQLLLDEGQVQAALGVLDAAIDAAIGTPEMIPAASCVGLYLRRAQIHVGLGQLQAALADTAEAVMLDRSRPEPKLRLGVLLVELGRFEEAIACLREALSALPQPGAFRGLALAYDRAGRPDQAAATLAEARQHWPRDYELRAAGVALAIRRRDFADAVAQAQAARSNGAINTEIFTMMGHAFAYLGQHGDAETAYRDALKFSPDDRWLQQLAALSGDFGRGETRSPERIRALFELIAVEYEPHILSLGYRVPGLILRALAAAGVPAGGSVLDLGCGTGLTAIAIADRAGPITGFDISPAMLQVARAKGIFAELREGDLPVLLAAEERLWPVIVAGDVLNSFGALEALLSGVQARLAPGGCFIFSVAALRPAADGRIAGNGDWALESSGQHTHALPYVERVLGEVGLAVRSCETETLREETGAPVPGWIIVAGHPGNHAQEISR